MQKSKWQINAFSNVNPFFDIWCGKLFAIWIQLKPIYGLAIYGQDSYKSVNQFCLNLPYPYDKKFFRSNVKKYFTFANGYLLPFQNIWGIDNSKSYWQPLLSDWIQATMQQNTIQGNVFIIVKVREIEWAKLFSWVIEI